MILESLPTRKDVDWTFTDDGNVIIFQEKHFGRFERIIAELFRAPKIVRRTLDEMNSELWMLMDGENSLLEIISAMDDRFAESIAPVSERVAKSISLFVEQGLVAIIFDQEEVIWNTQPKED